MYNDSDSVCDSIKTNQGTVGCTISNENYNFLKKSKENEPFDNNYPDLDYYTSN
jgi:hypothetical protein